MVVRVSLNHGLISKRVQTEVKPQEIAKDELLDALRQNSAKEAVSTYLAIQEAETLKGKKVLVYTPDGEIEVAGEKLLEMAHFPPEIKLYVINNSEPVWFSSLTKVELETLTSKEGVERHLRELVSGLIPERGIRLDPVQTSRYLKHAWPYDKNATVPLKGTYEEQRGGEKVVDKQWLIDMIFVTPSSIEMDLVKLDSSNNFRVDFWRAGSRTCVR